MVFLPSLALRSRAWDNGFGEKRFDDDGTASISTQCSSLSSSPLTLDRKLAPSLEEVYDIHEVIGEGGFGIVRRASLRSGGPSCAVKSIRKRSSSTEELANSEARILKCLSHVAINKLLTVCEDAEHIHLILEFVNGHELFSEIEDRIPLIETRAACIMKQTFAALQYCHDTQRSVIHRDIKPENIMISECVGENLPQVKIVDWGLAIVVDDVVQTERVGTHHYLAPESYREGLYSRASDMWSAGVVLYQLLTGGAFPTADQFGSGSEDTRISRAALNLLHGLLASASCQRLTAQEAGQDDWLCPAQVEERAESGVIAPALTDAADVLRRQEKRQECVEVLAEVDQLKAYHVNTKSAKLLADLKLPLALKENCQENWLGISSPSVSPRHDCAFTIFDDFQHSSPLRNNKLFETVVTPDKLGGCKQRSRKVFVEQCKENYDLNKKTCSRQEKTNLHSEKLLRRPRLR